MEERNVDSEPVSKVDRSLIAGILGRLLPPSDASISSQDIQLRALLLQVAISTLLRPFGLFYGDITLLYGATGTLVAGSIIEALSDGASDPDHIDFYCGCGAGSGVVRYMKHLGYIEEVGSEHISSGVIHKRIALRNLSGREVRIIEAHSYCPMDALAETVIAGQSRRISSAEKAPLLEALI